MVYAYVPNLVSISFSVTLHWRKTPIFAILWTSAFSGVANCQQSEKAEHGCTTTNVQKRDRQTDRQTKNSTFLAAPAAGEIQAPPNLAW